MGCFGSPIGKSIVDDGRLVNADQHMPLPKICGLHTAGGFGTGILFWSIDVA
jgi:hypothetical protein